MAPTSKSPAKPSDKAEWLILNSVENVERSKYLLGSVVPKVSQYNPFDDYSPHWADKNLDVKVANNQTGGVGKQEDKKTILRKTMGALRHSNLDFGDSTSTSEDAPVQLTDILTGKVAARTREMRMIVTDLFNLFLRKHEVQEVEIQAGTVLRYKIDNPGAKVGDTLMPCVPWKEQLQKLFDRTEQQKSPFFLVTGILICKDLEVRWKRDTGSSTDTTLKVDGNAVLAALHQPPNPNLAKYLDSKFNFNQEKSTQENVFATCKHEVIFAIRYNYLNLNFEKDPEAKEANAFMKMFTKSAKPGTIKGAKMGKVVLGRGIMSYATAVAKENKEDRATNKGDGTDTEGEEDEEDASINWFYSRPAIGLRNQSEDEIGDPTSAPVHQNGNPGAYLNGRA